MSSSLTNPPLTDKQVNSMNSWPTRTSSLPHYNGRSIKRKPIATKKDKVVTVAISGCSSSGKTTLVLLLAEIFKKMDKDEAKLIKNLERLGLVSSDRGAEKDKENVKPEMNSVKEGEDKVIGNGDHGIINMMNGNDGDGETKIAQNSDQGTIIIHEDAYFLEKACCPWANFKTTAADFSFMQKTLGDDQVGDYIISQGGPTSNSPTVSAAEDPCCQPSPVWQVTGPDTDSWSAIEFSALINTLKYVKKHGCLSEASLRRDDLTRVKFPGLLLDRSQHDAILAPHSSLIAELRGKVSKWSTSNTASSTKERLQGLFIQDSIASSNNKDAAFPKLAFIEGFLLYPDPTKRSSADNKENVDPSKNNDQDAPRQRSAILMMDEQLKEYQTLNLQLKDTLMPNFDIKLFLPLSKEQAKERRFGGERYIDAPEGVRVPGQMWKTDGYFEDVAWANYVRESRWLFEDGEECVASALAEAHGVRIRPTVDAGVEETVRWAVDTILKELRYMMYIEENLRAMGYVDDERNYEEEKVEEQSADLAECQTEQKFAIPQNTL